MVCFNWHTDVVGAALLPFGIFISIHEISNNAGRPVFFSYFV